MPAIPKTKKSQTVWAAKWEHKHGEDISLHTTEEGARKQLVAWARGSLDGWNADANDQDLVDNWCEITGETEALYVEDHILHSADVWEEVSEKTIKDVDVFEFPANE